MPRIAKRQIACGTRVEMEHTRSRKRARKIALDHLRERPDYYTALARVDRDVTRLCPGISRRGRR